MAYDLLIKNGRIVDGSGMPSFMGDIAVTGGKVRLAAQVDGVHSGDLERRRRA